MKKSNKKNKDQVYGRVQGYPTQTTGDYTNGIPTFDLEGFDVKPYMNPANAARGLTENSVFDDPVAMAMFGAFGRAGKFMPKQYAGNLASEMTMGIGELPISRYRSNPVARNLAYRAKSGDELGGSTLYEAAPDEVIPDRIKRGLLNEEFLELS